MADLKITCAKCDGTGVVWTTGIDGSNVCGLCQGVGFLVTAYSEEIDDLQDKVNDIKQKVDEIKTVVDEIKVIVGTP